MTDDLARRIAEGDHPEQPSSKDRVVEARIHPEHVLIALVIALTVAGAALALWSMS